MLLNWLKFEDLWRSLKYKDQKITFCEQAFECYVHTSKVISFGNYIKDNFKIK